MIKTKNRGRFATKCLRADTGSPIRHSGMARLGSPHKQSRPKPNLKPSTVSSAPSYASCVDENGITVGA